MKKFILILFSTLTFCLGLVKLNAYCEDVSNEAGAVFESVLNIDTGEEAYIEIELHNISENIYVVVLNDFNDTVRTFNYEDSEDGVVKFTSDSINYNINYVVRVYSKDTSCTQEPLKTISFRTAKFNEHSVSTLCVNPYEIDLCGAFYDVGDMSLDEFNEKVTALIEEIEKPFSKKLADFIKEYYLYVLIPFLIIVGIYAARIYILKRGKKNE